MNYTFSHTLGGASDIPNHFISGPIVPFSRSFLALIVRNLWVIFSHSVVCSSLWPHGLQQARLLSPLSSTISQSLLKFMAIELVMLSYLLPPPSPFAFTLSKPQRLFQWFTSLHPVTKVLELQLQHQSLQWIFRDDFL